MLSKSHREELLPGAAREVDETSRALSCAILAAIIGYPSHAFSNTRLENRRNRKKKRKRRRRQRIPID
jgi:hypothetical protein